MTLQVTLEVTLQLTLQVTLVEVTRRPMSTWPRQEEWRVLFILLSFQDVVSLVFVFLQLAACS